VEPLTLTDDHRKEDAALWQRCQEAVGRMWVGWVMQQYAAEAGHAQAAPGRPPEPPV
jgi:hypothetical protein